MNYKEHLVYVLYNNEEIHDYNKSPHKMTDEEFIEAAEDCGSIYNLKEFQEEFNNGYLNHHVDIIRILYV